MSQIISSNNISVQDDESSNWVYCGMDSAVTLLAFDRMEKNTSPNARLSYNFVSAMRAPALEMSLRGIRVDMEQRHKFMEKYSTDRDRLQFILDSFAEAVWGRGLNVSSPKQMKEFLYDCMGLPKVYKYYKGTRTLTADRDALEKLGTNFYAQPICSTSMALRDVGKTIQFLRTGLAPDGRFYTSFNVVGTETGRWSSSEDTFGFGGNEQNITDELRRILISDPNMKFGYFDMEQAESYVVAYRSGDAGYIAAIQSGDLHTFVARMCWPELNWTGDIKRDREIADNIYYRHFTYRDIAKRLGHATNYNGAARTLAGKLKVPEEVVYKFQQAYFTAFPGIRAWHHSVAEQLQTTGFLITILGRKRNFLGRRFDDATLREAIAHEPQSVVGELLNLFLHRVWEKAPELNVIPMSQIHDAILLQYPDSIEDEIIPKIKTLGLTPVTFPSGIMTIPIEAKVGWNFASEDKNNPSGLRKHKGHDARIPPVYKGILDWQIC